MAGEAITLHCVHGDTVLYPLAEIEIDVGGVTVPVKAAVSESLPVLVLLGTDVPELGELLKTDPNSIHSSDVAEAIKKERAKGTPFLMRMASSTGQSGRRDPRDPYVS